MVNIKDYLQGQNITYALVMSVPGVKRKLVITKKKSFFEDFPDQNNVSSTVKKLVVPVLFEGQLFNWIPNKKSLQLISLNLGHETDDWYDAVIDVEGEIKGPFKYVVAKAVYNSRLPSKGAL